LNGLTSKEATRIEEGLHAEHMLISKFGALANQAQDPECRRVLSGIQALHQRHYDILRRQVTSAGVQVGTTPGLRQASPGVSPTINF